MYITNFTCGKFDVLATKENNEKQGECLSLK